MTVLDKTRRNLLVEDNPGDVALFLEAINSLRLALQVDVAADGEHAVAVAQRVGPDLIVVDLHLPKLTGLEVLRRLRQDPGTRLVPVIVYSSTVSPGEVTAAYRAGANCAVQKPNNFDDFVAAVHDICTFWLQRAILPKQVGAAV